MFEIKKMHEQARAVERLLRLQSMPIALKMHAKEEDIQTTMTGHEAFRFVFL
jgi:uncharacterized protein (DUF169 family)